MRSVFLLFRYRVGALTGGNLFSTNVLIIASCSFIATILIIRRLALSGDTSAVIPSGLWMQDFKSWLNKQVVLFQCSGRRKSLFN